MIFVDLTRVKLQGYVEPGQVYLDSWALYTWHVLYFYPVSCDQSGQHNVIHIGTAYDRPWVKDPWGLSIRFSFISQFLVSFTSWLQLTAWKWGLKWFLKPWFILIELLTIFTNWKYGKHLWIYYIRKVLNPICWTCLWITCFQWHS